MHEGRLEDPEVRQEDGEVRQEYHEGRQKVDEGRQEDHEDRGDGRDMDIRRKGEKNSVKTVKKLFMVRRMQQRIGEIFNLSNVSCSCPQ